MGEQGPGRPFGAKGEGAGCREQRGKPPWKFVSAILALPECTQWAESTPQKRTKLQAAPEMSLRNGKFWKVSHYSQPSFCVVF